MKKIFFFNMMLIVILTTLGCQDGKRIHGGTGPGELLMPGWTVQMGGEHWLGSILNDTMTAGELSQLEYGNVSVNLPLYDSNPMPRFGVVYRQQSTGGFIIFNDSVCVVDSLLIPNTIGSASFQLREDGYFEMDSIPDVACLHQRGQGIFTLYHQKLIRKIPKSIEWNSVVISVYPGGDSLKICRGNFIQDPYIAEK